MTEDVLRPPDQQPLLTYVADKELDAITFVRSYMQFRFDDATLTVYNSPAVETPDGVATEGMSGYADRLRGLIGQKIVGATERDDHGLELVFAGGSVIRISPNPSLPEVALLQVGDGSVWAVW